MALLGGRWRWLRLDEHVPSPMPSRLKRGARPVRVFLVGGRAIDPPRYRREVKRLERQRADGHDAAGHFTDVAWPLTHSVRAPAMPASGIRRSPLRPAMPEMQRLRWSSSRPMMTAQTPWLLLIPGEDVDAVGVGLHIGGCHAPAPRFAADAAVARTCCRCSRERPGRGFGRSWDPRSLPWRHTPRG